MTASATWSSSDTAVATINSAGLAASVAAGTTTITATSGDISGTATLTVTNATLASIAVTPATPSIALGTTQQFTATGTFSNSTTQDLTTQVTWSSSDTGKATINSAGLATSVAEGSTTITAASGGISGSATLTIATLASIAVTPANPSIVRSATQQFTATGTFSNSATQNLTTQVTWSTTTTSVATISTAGMVTPISAGTTTITAVSGSISGNTTLTVQGVNLPKTGQTTCYDALGNVITCAGTGQDGALQKGVAWPSPRFTTNVDTTVTDNLTGLVWAPNGNLMPTRDNNWDQDNTVNDGAVTWQHALDYVAKLNTESYLGHTDWRLPNRKELRSLANYGQGNVATWLNTQGFSNVQAYYWSSTTTAGVTDSAWVVNMGDGGVNYSFKTNDYYVWPVRSGQESNALADVPKTGQITSYGTGTIDDGGLQRGVAWPSTRFTTNGDTTMTDNLTGLVWAPNGNLMPARDNGWDVDGTANDGAVTWQHALDYVAKLNTESYLGRTDWRMPNVNELESLVHAEYTKETTCSGSCATNAAWLNTQGFSNARPSYWSSATYAGNTAYAWYVDMSRGYVLPPYKPNYHYVWPVRSGQ